jgi:cell wall assembly regulator SMI1
MMSAALTRLKAVIAQVAPDADELFAPPASQENIARLEQGVGRLPDELRSLLLLHDGACLSIGRWLLAPAAEIEGTWQMLDGLSAEFADSHALTEPEPGVRALWWSARWIPFAGDGAGNHLCVDLDPAPGGCVGQVIEFVHDHGVRPRLADSLSDWFEKEAARLERGELVVVEDADGGFDEILDRSSLQRSLGLLRIRGESPDDRAARLERDTLSQPGVLAGHLFHVLRRRRIFNDPDGLITVEAWPLVERAFAGEGDLRARIHRALEDLRRFVSVGSEADAIADELLARLR